ncbi:MAG: GNAT family N-acetyltransferase [Candidatus Thiodiazotropha sp. (ex Lucinoma borealis)]|nr:GNAT family N-acetyltransferase [Candidatus Thiodiazotropha sp. (ex Lucinoma borealis)]MCU7857580.1 GNAT family N-acetyltransferase [Candidatus Thiodiazotropha sp. (ex Lucinoma borealis)]MCU7867609.1 GNAT family N-acetyltransferase [Candidatus Thiodiazotropha sp. (ex Lucinoma borealis)]
MMHPNYTTRDARPTDVGQMADLLTQLFTIEQGFKVDPVKQRAGLEMLLHADQAQLFVVEADGEVVAMASLQIVLSTVEGGPVGWVEDVIVDLHHREKGVGRMLLHHLEQWSDEHGLSRLQLVADQSNRSALDFYTRHSWHETGLIVLRQSQSPGT